MILRKLYELCVCSYKFSSTFFIFETTPMFSFFPHRKKQISLDVNVAWIQQAMRRSILNFIWFFPAFFPKMMTVPIQKFRSFSKNWEKVLQTMFLTQVLEVTTQHSKQILKRKLLYTSEYKWKCDPHSLSLNGVNFIFKNFYLRWYFSDEEALLVNISLPLQYKCLYGDIQVK